MKMNFELKSGSIDPTPRTRSESAPELCFFLVNIWYLWFSYQYDFWR